MKYKIPDNAKILSINPDYEEIVDNVKLTGLLLVTDKGNIKLLISAKQNCCEKWGALFLDTPDDITQFIDATVINIEDICAGLKICNELNICNDIDIECSETQLRITTTKGILQFAVYNSHNGSYNHATLLQVFDLQEESYL
jgi:hypothetical protein